MNRAPMRYRNSFENTSALFTVFRLRQTQVCGPYSAPRASAEFNGQKGVINWKFSMDLGFCLWTKAKRITFQIKQNISSDIRWRINCCHWLVCWIWQLGDQAAAPWSSVCSHYDRFNAFKAFCWNKYWSSHFVDFWFTVFDQLHVNQFVLTNATKKKRPDELTE